MTFRLDRSLPGDKGRITHRIDWLQLLTALPS
jgi:hypothetical protein